MLGVIGANVVGRRNGRRYWYVSNGGNDSNDGQTLATPLRTIAALLGKPLASGAVCCFERGGKWREQLTGLPNGSEVRAYGSGPSPIFDGSDVAANNTWTAVGGATPHVYSVPWLAQFDAAGGKTEHRAWEDGVRLRRVGSVAACESTAGSFFAPTPTGGTDTIYVHASDGSDITTNGRTYELTRRQWAVQLYASQNHAHVYDVVGQRNAYADGALCVDGGLHRCDAIDGRVHNVFVFGVCEDVRADGMEPDDNGFSTSFIVFTDANTPWRNGGNTVFRRCSALPDAGGIGLNGNRNVDTNVGFYAHCGSGHQLGTLQFDSCVVQNSLTAYDAAQVSTCVYYRCNASTVQYAYNPHAGNVDGTGGAVVILGGACDLVGSNSALLHYIDDFQIPDTLIVRGVRCYKRGGGLGPIIMNIAGTSASIRRCTLVADGSGCLQFLQSAVFDWSENLVAGPHDTLMIRLGLSGNVAPSFSGDHNAYWCAADNGAHFQRAIQTGGYTDYLSLAAWQTATGQEAHSLSQDPLLADPANGNFTIGNAAVAAIAGAMAEESDATLQALWAAYKVAA